MNHFILILFFLCTGIISQAQNEYILPDSLARNIKKDGHKTPEALARALCKNLKTDTEKARSIFTWIAVNVKYDFGALDRDNPKFDSHEELLKYREKMIQKAYTSQKGICMDYSRLYQKMVQTVGLECEFIGGHSKNFGGTWEKHAWNAVKINGQWQFIDATWAAGGSADGKKFKQHFKPGYFFPLPRLFALNHFPDDEKWQLLEIPISKKDFKNQAEISYGDTEEGITDVTPFGLPLAKGKDGKIEIQIKIKQPPATFRLTMGNKEIPATQTKKDGWTTLKFAPGSGRELRIWSVETKGNKMSGDLLGVFPVN